MSAEEHLNPGQFFHVTDARLKPGASVVPAAERGFQSKWAKGTGGSADYYSPNHVYVYSHDGDDMVHNEYMHLGRYTYEVEPQGGVEPDPEPQMTEGTAWRTSRATVKRKMPW